MAERSYPIPNQEIPALSYEAHLEDLKEFILLVESLGINVSGTSPTTIHVALPPTWLVCVSDVRDRPDGSSSVPMRRAQ